MIEGFAAGLTVGIVVAVIGVGWWLPPSATRSDLSRAAQRSRAQMRSRARHPTSREGPETWEDVPSNVRVLE